MMQPNYAKFATDILCHRLLLLSLKHASKLIRLKFDVCQISQKMGMNKYYALYFCEICFKHAEI